MQNRTQHRVQADGLPRSVSRLFLARKHFLVSLVGSRGNPPANANRSALRVNRFFFIVRLSLKLAYKHQAIKLLQFSVLAFGFFVRFLNYKCFTEIQNLSNNPQQAARLFIVRNHVAFISKAFGLFSACG